MNARNQLISRLATNLKHRTMTCSQWAEKYRMMGTPYPGPFRFTHHPWLREMHDCRSERMIGQKAAQMGYTECALNKAFYYMDVRKQDVMYVLPSQHPDVTDFSNARFNKAIEMSPHLQKVFDSVGAVGQKQAGPCTLYVGGSRSRSFLKSKPVGVVIEDEVEEMDQENIALIPQRMTGQLEKHLFALSTPSVAGVGINRMYLESDQRHFMFKCPCCGRWTELVWPDCLEITAESIHEPSIMDSRLRCKECDGTLDHKGKSEWLADGKWVAMKPGAHDAGFHVSQLYSSTMSPVEVAKAFLRAKGNVAETIEFFNSTMGLTYEAEGARITQKNILDCLGNHVKAVERPRKGIITMGIDVGPECTFVVCQWLTYGDQWLGRIIDCGTFVNMEMEIARLFATYDPAMAVIDQQPENKLTLQLAYQFSGRLYRCCYATAGGKVVSEAQDAERMGFTVMADRTYWMDMVAGRFQSGHYRVPQDRGIEFDDQVKTPVRTYRKDQWGNPKSFWVHEKSQADHMFHAFVYNEIAFAKLLAATEGEDYYG